MHRVTSSHTSDRAALLADALGESVAELRLIEPGDMIGYIRAGQWANIADLVQSATELSFRDGTLSFSCMAEFDVGWASPPSISLDMEFQTDSCSAFFTLFLGRRSDLVELKSLWFAARPTSEEAGTQLFADALAGARLPLRVAGRQL